MLSKKRLSFALILFLSPMLVAQEPESQEKKLTLAVLRITYDAFTDEEEETVNRKFYQDIAKDQRIAVITEAEVRGKLIPLGIEPIEITNEQGYTMVGQLLKADYVLIGTMDKIGNFVEVTFRTFKMPAGTHKRYPGGKTLDALLEEEIPNLISLIYKDIGLEEKEPVVQIPVPEKKQEEKPAEEMTPQKPVGKGPPLEIDRAWWRCRGRRGCYTSGWRWRRPAASGKYGRIAQTTGGAVIFCCFSQENGLKCSSVTVLKC